MVLNGEGKMDSITNLGLVVDQYIARIVAINLIVWGPIVVALSQVALSIREIK